MEKVFEVHLPQFDGPFDLLLFFIERDEVDIHNIPISKITNDFLEYIRQMNELNIELASEFILVAATLMRIKAKMLLPRPELDEQGNEIDPRKDLVERLLQYKQFKESCEDLRVLEDDRSMKAARGNIQRELKRLEKVGFLLSEKQGNTKVYHTNKHFLIFKELQSIVLKSQRTNQRKSQ